MPTKTTPKKLNISLDVDEFTLGEMEIIEVHGECPLAEMGSRMQSLSMTDDEDAPPPKPIMKLLIALAYIALLKDDDKATWKQAQEIKFAELMDSFEDEDGDDDSPLPPPPPKD